MKLEDLTQVVCDRSGVDLQAVQKVLDAAFGALNEEPTRKQRMELQGWGTFIRKQGGKTDKKGETLFRSWSATRAAGKKRARHKSKRNARKMARTGSSQEGAP
ncbi:MAG TPA: hypothetical protein VHX61_15970 [Rhizomicrobium sp.]|nr:hypothetical protein [Rhizomicrobium sp.]